MREKYGMETSFEEAFSSPFFKVFRIHSLKAPFRSGKGGLPDGKT
jgi:hypothetical protein